MNSDLKYLLYPFVIGMFVGGAVVAVAGDRTSEREFHKVSALSQEQARQCDAAVKESRRLLWEMAMLRKEACDDAVRADAR